MKSYFAFLVIKKKNLHNQKSSPVFEEDWTKLCAVLIVWKRNSENFISAVMLYQACVDVHMYQIRWLQRGFVGQSAVYQGGSLCVVDGRNCISCKCSLEVQNVFATIRATASWNCMISLMSFNWCAYPCVLSTTHSIDKNFSFRFTCLKLQSHSSVEFHSNSFLMYLFLPRHSVDLWNCIL